MIQSTFIEEYLRALYLKWTLKNKKLFTKNIQNISQSSK